MSPQASSHLAPGDSPGACADMHTSTTPEPIAGTPQYMAPEQRSSPNAVDHRADIYALGVVFYQMLNFGELPPQPPSPHLHQNPNRRPPRPDRPPRLEKSSTSTTERHRIQNPNRNHPRRPTDRTPPGKARAPARERAGRLPGPIPSLLLGNCLPPLHPRHRPPHRHHSDPTILCDVCALLLSQGSLYPSRPVSRKPPYITWGLFSSRPF